MPVQIAEILSVTIAESTANPTAPTAPGYPGYENPCNGCGLCCISEQCPASLAIYGLKPRCPALAHTGQRFICEMMIRPIGHLEQDIYAPALLAKLMPPPDLIEHWRSISSPSEFEEMMALAFQVIIASGQGCDAQPGLGEEWPTETWTLEPGAVTAG
jgi:hypothetical protein